MRHERRAGDDAMAVPLEVLEKGRANLLRGHWLYCTGPARALTASRADADRMRAQRATRSDSKPWRDQVADTAAGTRGRRRSRSRPRSRFCERGREQGVGVDAWKTSSTARAATAGAIPAASICCGRAACRARARLVSRPGHRAGHPLIVEAALGSSAARWPRRSTRRSYPRRARRWRTCASDSSRRASIFRAAMYAESRHRRRF